MNHDATLSEATRAVTVLSRALDHAGDVVAAVHDQDMSAPTPCGDWTVAALIGHMLDDMDRFMEQAEGGDPEWSAPPDPVASNRRSDFRSRADDLIHRWHQRGEAAPPMQVDFQIAELALHSWDLARAAGEHAPLDTEVAERALAFLQQALTDENREPAFGPARQLPEGADAEERLVAFAGRDPRAWPVG